MSTQEVSEMEENKLKGRTRHGLKTLVFINLPSLVLKRPETASWKSGPSLLGLLTRSSQAHEPHAAGNGGKINELGRYLR